MHKTKLLIITYNFPPVGGIAVQRVIKWIKYLPQNGITPLVLCPKQGFGYVQDVSLLELDYIKKTKVYRRGGTKLSKYHALKNKGKLYSLHNILLLIRYIWNIDIFSSWFYEIKNELKDIIQNEHIDCVLTTSPPHSNHLFGYFIKRECGIPWIMDLRDSMTLSPISTDTIIRKLQSRIESFYEKRFYDQADKVIFATNLMKKHAMIRKKSLSDEKTVVIRNGFDPDDFSNVEKIKKNENKFCITYTGTMQATQNPKPFCDAIINLIRNNRIDAEYISIRVVGRIDPDKQKTLHSLANITTLELTGRVDHRKAIKYQLEADLLFLVVTANLTEIGKEVLTGKVFEYIGAGKPILAITPEGELADLIREHNLGYVADPRKIEEIADAILSAYTNWKKGVASHPVRDRVQFTREYQCKLLSTTIKEIV